MAADDAKREDRERIDWLLELVRCDIESLSFGELIDMRDRASAFWGPRPTLDLEAVIERSEKGEAWAPPYDQPLRTVGPREEVRASASDFLHRLQRPLRAGMDSLEQGKEWELFSDEDGLPAPQWKVEHGGDGGLFLWFPGTFTATFLATAVDLIVRWWPELRKCEYEACGVWFLPHHGRQRYHDPKCSSAKRQERYKPKRDYAAEYERRVQREVGPNVKPNSRKDGGNS